MKHLCQSAVIETLRFAGGLRYAELATALGIKPGTVMSRLARLKEKLGHLLGDESDE